MTDARLPERFLNDRRIVRLAPEDFQGYVLSMLWSVANRTDGLIEVDDLPLLPWVRQGAPERFVSRGLWASVAAGWIITDFESTQTSRHDLEVLENMRRAGREKKARQRAAKAGVTTDVPGDVAGGLSPGTSRGRVPEDATGQERTGRDQRSEAITNGYISEMQSRQQEAMTAWANAT